PRRDGRLDRLPPRLRARAPRPDDPEDGRADHGPAHQPPSPAARPRLTDVHRPGPRKPRSGRRAVGRDLPALADPPPAARPPPPRRIAGAAASPRAASGRGARPASPIVASQGLLGG